MKGPSKVCALVLGLLLVFSLTSAMAGGQKQAEQSGGGETAPQKVYELKIGHANAPADNSALHVTAMALKDAMEKRSNGQIVSEIYPSGQLGTDAEMADLTVSGAQDVFVTSLNLITNYAPRLRALILPYMFEDSSNFRQAREALWGEINDYLAERSNLHLVALWDSGYRHVMSTKPVRTLADLKKLKFRVPPSPVMIEMVKSWGVSPTPVEWSEVFNALQLGVIDAIEVDDSVLISARMNEVVKYITDDDHILQVSVAVMNEELYQSLPAELQRAVDQAVEDAKVVIDNKSSAILAEAREVSKTDHGVQFLGRPTDYPVWAQKARTIWPGFYEDIGEGDAAVGKEVVDRVFEAAGMTQ